MKRFPLCGREGIPSDLPHKVSIDGIHVQTVDGEVEASLRYPVGVIIPADFEGVAAGSSGLLVANPRLFFSVTGEQKKNVIGNLFVNLPQDGLVKLRLLHPDLKHFDLRDFLPSGNVHGGRCQLVAPVDNADLFHKHPLESRRDIHVLIELLLWDAFIKFCSFG